MNNDFSHLLALITYFAGMLFLLFLVIGFCLKMLSVLIPALAFPTYLAIIAMEWFLPREGLLSRLLSLNIPKKNPRRIVMHTAGFISTSMALALSADLYSAAIRLGPDKVVDAYLNGQVASLAGMGMLLISLLVVFGVSYISERDDSDTWTKLENLSIPSLWKNVLKLDD